MPPEDFLVRFRKICGLLGSDHVGERSNAANLATEMLRSVGLTWQDISISIVKKERPRQERPSPDWYTDRPYRPRREEAEILVDVEVIADREKSYLVEYKGREIWLPKSQITIVINNDPYYQFSVPAWLAREKGFV